MRISGLWRSLPRSERHDRELLILLVLCSLALLAAVRWYYDQQAGALETAAVQELAAVADAERAHIVTWRNERFGDARTFLASPGARIALRVLGGTATKDDAAQLLMNFEALKRHLGYGEVALVAADGSIRLRTGNEKNTDFALNQARRRALLQQAVAARDCILSDMSPDNRARRNLLMLAAPLSDKGGLILQIDPSTFLAPLLRWWVTAGRSAETYLARRTADEIVYLTELRKRAGGSAPVRRSIKGLSLPNDNEIEAGAVLRFPDYAGAEAIGQARSIPNTSWFVIAKVDAAEVRAPLARLSVEMGAILLLLALAVLGGVGVIWKNRQLRLQQESEARFRTIADSTPAFLWMATADASEIFVNKALADFLGVPGARITSDWTAYLHPDDAPRASSKLRECFAKRRPYRDEARMQRADGEFRWVTCEGIPRFAVRGEFLGYAGALLDITVRMRREEEVRALSARLIDAQQEERTRLSRELHDDLSQQIAALSLAMGGLRRSMPESMAEARGQTDRLQQKLIGLSETVRRISHELHPSVLRHSGLAAALRSYCAELGKLNGIAVSLTSEGDVAGLQPSVALHIYRIAQEALRNVARHAHTRTVEVELIRRGKELRLSVVDHGVGMDPERENHTSGLGLVSMRERARLVHGVLNIESDAGTGTRLTLRIADLEKSGAAGVAAAAQSA